MFRGYKEKCDIFTHWYKNEWLNCFLSMSIRIIFCFFGGFFFCVHSETIYSEHVLYVTSRHYYSELFAIYIDTSISIKSYSQNISIANFQVKSHKFGEITIFSVSKVLSTFFIRFLINSTQKLVVNIFYHQLKSHAHGLLFYPCSVISLLSMNFCEYSTATTTKKNPIRMWNMHVYACT